MARRIVAVVLCSLLVAFVARPATAQPLTQQQGDEILKELRALRAAIDRIGAQQAARPGAPEPDPRIRLPKVDGHVLGRADAPLTMVEFTDLQCPFCGRFATTTFQQLKTEYIDKGLMRFVTYDFPLDMHAHAELAARASRCAGDQNRYWDVRMVLAANPGRISPDFITSTAEAAKMDMKAFRACVDSSKYRDEVRTDLQRALALGVQGTPTFAIGLTQPEGFDGELVVGALPFSAFDAKLKALSPAAK